VGVSVKQALAFQLHCIYKGGRNIKFPEQQIYLLPYPSNLNGNSINGLSTMKNPKKTNQ